MRKWFWASVLGLLVFGPAAAAATDSTDCRRCIAVYGDSRAGHRTHRKIVKDILALKPELVLYTGDMVSHAKAPDEWRTFGEIIEPMRKATDFYPVLGNHDEDGAETMFAILPHLQGRRWLALERRGVQFLLLDSQLPLGKDSEQRLWLASQLANRPAGASFTVVVLHEPVLSTGPHGPSKLSDELAKLFEANSVALVVAGHDHDYEHLVRRGVHYVVTGGGGARLYSQASDSEFSKKFVKDHHYLTLSVTGDGITVEAFDVDNQPIDSFTVARKDVAPAPVTPAAAAPPASR